MRAISLMVINDFYVNRSLRAAWPLEADAPLIIDPNAVLPLTVAIQCFQSIPWER